MILPIGRLKKRVAAGRIELTGMMLNMSEIADEIVLAASLAPLCEMRAAFGDAVRKLPVRDPEGIYVALRMAAAGVRLAYEGQGGHRQPGGVADARPV